ncbi:hypothetical protein TNCV_5042091 [Trichonephila clavipes]|uniref:Uncharacterized protein n=1 Tax=Trichonephila clavipes TaxID=2585209 RepID=A0A8X6R8I5_TRICX|nr:hypothetical protein TNCV_5042091 [Trichonephila clavipes]
MLATFQPNANPDGVIIAVPERNLTERDGCALTVMSDYASKNYFTPGHQIGETSNCYLLKANTDVQTAKPNSHQEISPDLDLCGRGYRFAFYSSYMK